MVEETAVVEPHDLLPVTEDFQEQRFLKDGEERADGDGDGLAGGDASGWATLSAGSGLKL